VIHLVFVHGVANRKTPDEAAYQAVVRRRQIFFEQFCFENSQVAFYEPFWGDVASKPSMNFASIPLADGESLSIGSPDLGWVEDDQRQTTILLTAARLDFAGVINSIAIELASEENDNVELADALACYAMSRGVQLGGELVPPSWVMADTLTDDVQFLDRLELEATAMMETASLGLGNVIRRAGMRLLNTGLDVVSGVMEPFARKFTPDLATFLGDAFVYLREGEARANIRQRVLEGLQAALAAKKAGDKIVVVAHSMGANIVYDMLTDPEYRHHINHLGTPVEIDLFLSVGTQLGLFQEYGLFRRNADNSKGPKPPGCERWWHVFNRMDVLSFAAADIFDGVEQFSVNTCANILNAHGAYFNSILFMRRLQARLKYAGVIAQ